MCVIPAKIAGVKEITVCSPKISPLVIVAANIAGAWEVHNRQRRDSGHQSDIRKDHRYKDVCHCGFGDERSYQTGSI